MHALYAFDSPGRAGKNDRPNASTPLLVGVAHQFQLVEHLEVQRWDVPMHLIVTPSELVATPGSTS